MARHILTVVIIIVIVLGYFLFLIYASQEFVFSPKRAHIYEPTVPHEKIMIEDRLSAWHFKNYPHNKTILFCHGNYGNISYADFLIDICQRQKLNLLIFDYSGYGHSKGYPSQRQVCLDGEAAYHYLRRTLEPDQILLWGMSLGGAIATHVASRHPCSHLILLSTFSSLDDIFLDANTSATLSLAVRIIAFLIDTMPSRERISDVKCPVVIMHSRKDELIPYSNSRRLFDRVSHRCKHFIEIGGGHVTPVITNANMEDLFNFCCLDSTECHRCQDVLDRLPAIAEDYLQKEKHMNRPEVKH